MSSQQPTPKSSKDDASGIRSKGAATTSATPTGTNSAGSSDGSATLPVVAGPSVAVQGTSNIGAQNSAPQVLNASDAVADPGNAISDNDNTIDDNNNDDDDGGNNSDQQGKSRTPRCSACFVHNRIVPKRGHKYKCPFRTCSCQLCLKVNDHRKLVKEQVFYSRQLKVYGERVAKQTCKKRQMEETSKPARLLLPMTPPPSPQRDDDVDLYRPSTSAASIPWPPPCRGSKRLSALMASAAPGRGSKQAPASGTSATPSGGLNRPSTAGTSAAPSRGRNRSSAVSMPLSPPASPATAAQAVPSQQQAQPAPAPEIDPLMVLAMVAMQIKEVDRETDPKNAEDPKKKK